MAALHGSQATSCCNQAQQSALASAQRNSRAACLNIVVEDEVGVAVPLQQRLRIGHVEVLKLQHSVWPAPHDCLHELVYDLQAHRSRSPGMVTAVLSLHI